jgi:RNase P protein component
MSCEPSNKCDQSGEAGVSARYTPGSTFSCLLSLNSTNISYSMNTRDPYRIRPASTSTFSYKRNATRATKRHGLRFTRTIRHWYRQPSRLPPAKYVIPYRAKTRLAGDNNLEPHLPALLHVCLRVCLQATLSTPPPYALCSTLSAAGQGDTPPRHADQPSPTK